MRTLKRAATSSYVVLLASSMMAGAAMAQTATAPPAAPGQGAGQGSKEIPAPRAPQTTPQHASVAMTDVEFVGKAAVGNRYEVEAARIAVGKASSAKTEEFAGMLVRDHGEILNDLEKATKEADLAIPSSFTPDADQKARLEALKAKSGAEFDKLFLADMTKAHEDSLALLTLYMQTGKQPKLQAWAGKVLPTVQKHRDMLKDM